MLETVTSVAVAILTTQMHYGFYYIKYKTHQHTYQGTYFDYFTISNHKYCLSQKHNSDYT